MKKISWFRIFALISLFIPITIFVIGDYLGVGIQFPTFRFQESYLGISIIPINKEWEYILKGLIRSKSAISIALWIIGLLLIIASLLVTFYNNCRESKKFKFAGIFLCSAAILFLISLFMQYGPLFHGPAGIAIPIGLPVLFVIGGWMYMEGRKEEVGDDEEEVQEIEEE